MDSDREYLVTPRSSTRRHRWQGKVGFPIRKSADQGLFSAPHGLSQSITSFIASCCQGIHQTPFLRLIRSRKSQAFPGTEVVIRGFRTSRPRSPTFPCCPRDSRPGAQRGQCVLDLERLQAHGRPVNRTGRPDAGTRPGRNRKTPRRPARPGRRAADHPESGFAHRLASRVSLSERCESVRDRTKEQQASATASAMPQSRPAWRHPGISLSRRLSGMKWWSLSGSNRRPPDCKSGALPAELRPPNMVGRGGLEPPTSRLSGVRSNHLSYRPRQAGRPDVF